MKNRGQECGTGDFPKQIELNAATVNLIPMDWRGNLDKIRTVLKEVQRKSSSAGNSLPAISGAFDHFPLSVLCLPELCLTGNDCGDWFLYASTGETALEQLASLIPETSGVLMTSGLPLEFEGDRYKATAVIFDRKLYGFYVSSDPSMDFLVDESRWFKPWKKGRVAVWKNSPGTALPSMDSGEIIITDGTLSVAGLTIGFCDSSCFTDGPDFIRQSSRRPGNNENPSDPEKRMTENAVLENSRQDRRKVDLWFVSGTVPFELGRYALFQQRLREWSLKNRAPVLYSTSVGLGGGSLIYDGGSMIVSGGESVAVPRFSCLDTQLVSLTVAADRGEDGTVVFKPCLAAEEQDGSDAWESGADRWFEELPRAVALGLFDYLWKSHSRRFTLSLSGGADSAAIAVMIRLMVLFYRRTDKERKIFAEKLTGNPEITQLANRNATDHQFVHALLTTVYQATRNSSEVTRNAARQVAQAIGAEHYEFEIEPLVEGYKNLVGQVTRRSFSWQTDDLALQNIQARVRVPGVWFLANLTGGLLLSTGNRSEASCGYATMDGDTSGGISPIAGIDKHHLRKWLVWMEKTGVLLSDGSRFRIPELRFITEQQPTAELRPSECHQKDETDLMPYLVLNLIENAVIRDKKDVRTAFRTVQAEAGKQGLNCSDRQLAEWMILFYRRWTQSQWKRNRLAGGFHLDQYDVSPFLWSRFPVLSDGFQKEIAILEELYL